MTIYVLYFTTRISVVTAVRFVIVDFKELNEWMNCRYKIRRDHPLTAAMNIQFLHFQKWNTEGYVEFF